MDGPHKQEFHVRDLPTRSVTLFPARAQVVRDIRDVVLKPGANEITVVGLTPTVDEHSIKVEGTGSAIITDMTVELLPNRDIFQEMYPDSDSDHSDKEESDEDGDDETVVVEALEEVRDKLAALGDEQKRAKEVIASAESRLKILDTYSTSLDKKCGVDIEASVESYRKEREKVFTDHMEGIVRERELAKEITNLRREQARLEKLQAKQASKAAKEKAKTKRAKEKLREKERRRKAERQKEKARIRKEREQFWPRFCYTVRISLDTGATFTPGSSRRSSIASATDVHLVSDKEAKEEEEEEEGAAASMTCDLMLSYVTSSAFWAPSYDLALSSTANTATLCFDARLTNMTSETWSNCKVILSTSQASFSGLQDDTPTLVPWRLKIFGKGGPWDAADIVHSREERAQKQIWNSARNAMDQQKPRAGLFGISEALQDYAQQLAMLEAQNRARMQMAQQVQQQRAAKVFRSMANPNSMGGPAFGSQQAAVSNSGFGQPGFGSLNNAATAVGAPNNVPPAGSGVTFGSSVAPKPAGSGGGLFGLSQTVQGPSAFGGTSGGRVTEAEEVQQISHDTGGHDEADDAQTMLEPAPVVAFQESSFEETGLTATYDLPHLKTLKPSPTASKQRVARISFSHVTFSRTVVPKYKPAAYLKARLRNTSKITLLSGPTGLTLDGTFLGRATLPRCSAGDSFHVPLGIDPAIRVAYPKPDIARSTTGNVFTAKGESNVYTRSVTLVNTRAQAGRPPVSVTVLDQVPVSEDEKIRVDVLHPPGLQRGGPVATGVSGKVEASASALGEKGEKGEKGEDKDWGRATAALSGKAGEVAWDVVLNAGRSVKLVLQYEVAFPTGERVAQVN
ncbi:uncharacterized protein B0T15DRAFT_509873 [Chaetomium strumarium]|uniref:Mucoidy inhibitor-like protein n=1 Tax=Chaetomium strumarium TaxID=1170767 RepID=A0AAJ0GUN1_9PEZI|nr:hypothetical protein B0T15DRAFT_509873 [Chaetomium strumarium]